MSEEVWTIYRCKHHDGLIPCPVCWRYTNPPEPTGQSDRQGPIHKPKPAEAIKVVRRKDGGA